MKADPAGTTIAVGSENGNTLILNADSLARVHTLATQGSINDLDFSVGGLLATASDDRAARLWDIETGEQQSRTLAHGGEVNTLAFDAEGQRLLTGATDQRALVWQVDTATVLGRALAQRSPLSTVAFSSDGSRAATASA